MKKPGKNCICLFLNIVLISMAPPSPCLPIFQAARPSRQAVVATRDRAFSQLCKTFTVQYIPSQEWKRSFREQGIIRGLVSISLRKKVCAIFVKVSPQNDRFSQIANMQKYLQYFFSFQDIWKIVVFYIIFNSAHFRFFFLLFFTALKEYVHPLEFEGLRICSTSQTIKKY